MHSKKVYLAASLLKEKNVIAIPTETVYGLAAGIFYPEAIEKIFMLKKRPQDNPLIAHISNFDQVHEIARDIPGEFWTLAKKFFPGPLTLVVKKHPNVPLIATGGQDSIAIRMPNHPIALEIIENFNMPIVAPSANLSGRPSPTSEAHVKEDFGDKIPLIVDGGQCSIGIESTVVSLVGENPQILRPGTITAREIESALQTSLQTTLSHEVLSPGMKYQHYAPKTPLMIFENLEEIRQYVERNKDERFWVLTIESLGVSNEKLLSEKTLYSLFRESEKTVDKILIYLCPKMRKKKGLLNRLLKASSV